MSQVADWNKPQPVTHLELAFGGDMSKLLPRFDELPEEFRKDYSPWCKVVDRWFFKGLDDEVLMPKPGIDKREALSHCAAIICSFEPKHEHKIGGIAYLMSLWFEPVKS